MDGVLCRALYVLSSSQFQKDAEVEHKWGELGVRTNRLWMFKLMSKVLIDVQLLCSLVA